MLSTVQQTVVSHVIPKTNINIFKKCWNSNVLVFLGPSKLLCDILGCRKMKCSQCSLHFNTYNAKESFLESFLLQNMLLSLTVIALIYCTSYWKRMLGADLMWGRVTPFCEPCQIGRTRLIDLIGEMEGSTVEISWWNQSVHTGSSCKDLLLSNFQEVIHF